MRTSASNQDLEKQIERVVREHIATSQKVAEATVLRVFGESSREPARQSRRTKRTPKMVRRRSPDEVAALSERFYAAVCQMPGETMTVLARQLGMKAEELTVPVARLKQAGRVRSVGQRQFMKYFPLTSEIKVSKEAKA